MKYVLLVFLLLFSTLIFAQIEPLIIPKTDQSIVLDGKLDDAIWVDAQVFSFTEFSPNWGTADSLTTMYVTFDNQNLYIGFRAEEPQTDQIIQRSLQRDRYYGDDYVSFHIDPNLTKKNGFVFSVFPAGSRFDMAVSNDAVPLGNSTFNTAYDMIWTTETQITTNGWTTEMQIPLSNLRFIPDAQGQFTAGISGLRSQNHINRNVTSPRVPQEATNAIESPSLKRPVIFTDLKPRKQLQITPYILAAANNKYQLQQTNQYKKQSNNDFEAGLDLRYGISSKLTLDLTYNTDFAQVEIDDQVINIGNRANIFLPEKRKFFQEQAGLFDFSLGPLSQLFYSRNIGINDGRLTPLYGGIRLTGEVAGTDLGFLSLQSESIDLDNEERLPSENFSVLRLRKKVLNERSFIGLMGTSRIRKNDYNTTVGTDGVFYLPDNHVIISALSTSIDKAVIDTYDLFDNSRMTFLLTKRQQSGWTYTGSYEFSGERFNPSMGFLLRERHHNFFTLLNYGKFNNERKDGLFNYQKWTLLNSDLYYKTDFSNVITWYNQNSWRGRLFSGDELFAFGQIQYEFLDHPITYTNRVQAEVGEYYFIFGGISFSPAVQRKLRTPITIEYGQFFAGTRLKFALSTVINLNRHFNIDGSWEANYLKFPTAAEWIHTMQIKLNWALNLHLSGSIISQYNSITNQVFLSTRLRYNFSDGHDFYFVFNQNNNTQRERFTPLLPVYNNQNFTVKYSYTFSR